MRSKHLSWILVAAILSTLAAAGENLIKDGDCGAEPMSEEFGLCGITEQATLSLVADGTDGNRCLKFELTKYRTDKDGKRLVNTKLRIGGTRRVWGFPCKPDTLYRFSVEIKGDAPRAMIDFLEWPDPANNYRGCRTKRTDVHLIRPQKEWTRYQGSFRTGPDAKRAALCIVFWGNEAKRDMPEKIGQYVLIDRIRVEEAGPETDAAR